MGQQIPIICPRYIQATQHHVYSLTSSTFYFPHTHLLYPSTFLAYHASSNLQAHSHIPISPTSLYLFFMHIHLQSCVKITVICCKQTYTNLKVRNHSMEVREDRETEEGIDNVVAEVKTFLPVFSQHSGKCTQHCLCRRKFIHTLSQCVLLQPIYAQS